MVTKIYKGDFYEHNYYITKKQKNKHLSFHHYEYIIHQVAKHDAIHNGKKRNTVRTALIHKLVSDTYASVSTIYSILKDAALTLLDSNLKEYTELSACAALVTLN